jgi:hypothetical protein
MPDADGCADADVTTCVDGDAGSQWQQSPHATCADVADDAESLPLPELHPHQSPHAICADVADAWEPLVRGDPSRGSACCGVPWRSGHARGAYDCCCAACDCDAELLPDAVPRPFYDGCADDATTCVDASSSEPLPTDDADDDGCSCDAFCSLEIPCSAVVLRVSYAPERISMTDYVFFWFSIDESLR